MFLIFSVDVHFDIKEARRDEGRRESGGEVLGNLELVVKSDSPKLDVRLCDTEFLRNKGESFLRQARKVENKTRARNTRALFHFFLGVRHKKDTTNSYLLLF